MKDKDKEIRKQIIQQNKEFDKWENSIEGVLYELHTIGDATVDDQKDKILIAKTLLKLPKKIKRKVLDADILFILPRAVGTLGRLQTPLSFQDFIILNFSHMKRGTEMDCIAHEIAHFVLGHKNFVDSGSNAERKADDLTEKWGFRRAYKTYDIFEVKNSPQKIMLKLNRKESK